MNPSPDIPHLSKPYPVRLLLARPRLFISVAIGIAVYWLLPLDLARQPITRAITTPMAITQPKFAVNTGVLNFRAATLQTMAISCISPVSSARRGKPRM